MPETLTTRQRIVNRALAAPEPVAPAAAAGGAVVVDLAAARDRRRPKQPDEVPKPARPSAVAPVIALTPKPPARAPPEPQTAPTTVPSTLKAGPAVARGPPQAAPGPGAAPERVVGPAAGAAPTSTPAAGAAPESSADGRPPATAPQERPAPAPPGVVAAQPGTAGGDAAPDQAGPGSAPGAAPGAAPAGPAGPAAPAVIRNPEDDPGFQAMKARARVAGERAVAHQPGALGAATAQGASAPDPQKDVDSQAAGAQVEEMGTKEPGPFDPATFKRAVKQAIEAMAPPATLEEADEFKESGQAAQATTEIHGLVTGGQADSERDIKAATEAAPDPSGKVPKPLTKMVNDAPGPPLPDPGAAGALPGPRPPEQTDLSSGPMQVDAKMAEADVTEEQLADANEPDFAAALAARQEVREHADADPAAYRTQEELVLTAGRTEVEGIAATRLEGMHGARAATLGGVLGAKDGAKLADQQLREGINQSILDIHERAQADVKAILGTLDTTVDKTFTEGEAAARTHFESYVDQRMALYKADRYGGVFGGAYWLKDKAFDLPDEVNEFYRDGRETYLRAMDGVIDAIAAVVGQLLGAAQVRIQAGRDEVRTFVADLPVAVQKLGADTASGLDNRFDQLSADVDAKRDELVDTIAHKYVESRDQLDARITELQDANKGFVSKAIDAVVGIIRTIAELGKLLLRVLLKAASAIGDIIAHPIRFLGNLIDGVKGGLDRFVSRIGVHLQESLLDLLFGEIGRAGITMPNQLDFAGILDLVLQVLGLTYQNLRARIVKRFGEPVVARMEQTVDIFTTLAKDGIVGLWQWIQAKIADLSDLVIAKIEEFIIERVVKAGIGYVVALLNPAAAFIKACQGIYQIIMFIVERAKQIAQFVDAILDSISAIAQGNVGAAVEKVEGALANGLTLAIAFLARLANLGAISEKVISIIAAVREPITQAVDAIVFNAAEFFRKTAGPVLEVGKAKVQSGKDFLKGKTGAEKHQLKHAPEHAGPTSPKHAAIAPPATSPEPLTQAAGPGPLVIHESFSSEGHAHEIYTGVDGKQLILSSGHPTPITEIHDDEGILATLNAKYLAARARYEDALAELATSPGKRTGWTTRRDEVNAIVDLIVARIKKLGVDDSPGASAPGIGDVRRHGHQVSSIRKGPRVWWLESEHVLPFAVGKHLWDAVGELTPGRGGAEDNQQTTIMIYEPAARKKTSEHDGGAIRSFKSEYADHLRPEAVRYRELMKAEGRVGADSEARRGFTKILGRVFARMAQISSSAVAATQAAVNAEHAQADRARQTNGGRRAEKANLPADGQIAAAVEQQKVDVINLVRATVARAERR